MLEKQPRNMIAILTLVAVVLSIAVEGILTVGRIFTIGTKSLLEAAFYSLIF